MLLKSIFGKAGLAPEREKEDINRQLLDVIVPLENFDFAPRHTTESGRAKHDPQHLKAGATYRQVLACDSFPTRIRTLNWMSPLFTTQNVIASIVCEAYQKSVLAKDIDTEDDRTETMLLAARKSSKKEEYRNKLNHSQTILEMQSDEDEPFFLTTAYGQVISEDDTELRQAVSDFSDTMASACSISVSTASHNQKGAFLGASPLMIIDKVTTSQCAKPMPVSTLAAALPFSQSGLDDGCGITIGKDDTGATIRLDVVSTSRNRSNRNFAVAGKAGMGKTTFIQKLVVNLVADGTTVIMIDPEREERDLCRRLHGQWVNLGGGSSYSICPTAPRASSTDVDEDDLEATYKATQNHEVLTETVSFLRSFFAQAAGCTRKEIDYLEKVFKTVYAKFNITYQTPLKDIDTSHYPLLKDILVEVTSRAKEAKGGAKEDLETLAGKIWPMVEGSTASLWSNPTTMKAKSNFIVLDTHDLNERDSNIKSAQYYNVLTWVWDQIVQARITGKNIFIFIDEAHLLLCEEMEQAAQRVSQIAKRIRKYLGGLVCSTQEVKDFSKYGAAILDQATYRILLPNDGEDLEKERTLFRLTDDTCIRLEKGLRGQGIIMAGNEKVWAEIEVLDYEKPYIFGDEKVT